MVCTGIMLLVPSGIRLRKREICRLQGAGCIHKFSALHFDLQGCCHSHEQMYKTVSTRQATELSHSTWLLACIVRASVTSSQLRAYQVNRPIMTTAKHRSGNIWQTQRPGHAQVWFDLHSMAVKQQICTFHMPTAGALKLGRTGLRSGNVQP